MSGSETRPSIGRRKWEKIENVPDLSDGLYAFLKTHVFQTEKHEKQKSQPPFFTILDDWLMVK